MYAIKIVRKPATRSSFHYYRTTYWEGIMSPLKVILPLFIVLGILQAAVLSLPFVYWRFAGYMGPINKFLFGSFLYNPTDISRTSERHANTTQTLLSLCRAPPPDNNPHHLHNRAHPSLPAPQPHIPALHSLHRARTRVDLRRRNRPPIQHTFPRNQYRQHHTSEGESRLARHRSQQLRGLEGTWDAAESDGFFGAC